MPNRIINVAVHDLRKGTSGFDVVLAQEELVTNATIQRVIDDLHELYSRRSSKSHGRFSDNQADYPTQAHLKTYVEAPSPDFQDLTAKLMTTLRLQAQRRPNASGGHVFFAHFERDNRQFLLVAIVTDRLGAALTRDLKVRDVQHLDMDGFRFAGRINLTAWSLGEARYVGFLKGKGDVSEYFREFLGCDATVQERQDTADLVTALKSFADQQGMDATTKDQFLERAKLICERAIRQRQEIEFPALANELTPADPELLLHVLTDPDRGLNDRFIPHRGALGPLIKFKARTPRWSVEFEREALTEGTITYDSGDNVLIIRDIPPELSNQLRAERGSDGAS